VSIWFCVAWPEVQVAGCSFGSSLVHMNTVTSTLPYQKSFMWLVWNSISSATPSMPRATAAETMTATVIVRLRRKPMKISDRTNCARMVGWAPT